MGLSLKVAALVAAKSGLTAITVSPWPSVSPRCVPLRLFASTTAPTSPHPSPTSWRCRPRSVCGSRRRVRHDRRSGYRSEEHTSELQSQSNLGCRFFNDTATTEIYTLSLHDALPIFLPQLPGAVGPGRSAGRGGG